MCRSGNRRALRLPCWCRMKGSMGRIEAAFQDRIFIGRRPQGPEVKGQTCAATPRSRVEKRRQGRLLLVWLL